MPYLAVSALTLGLVAVERLRLHEPLVMAEFLLVMIPLLHPYPSTDLLEPQ